MKRKYFVWIASSLLFLSTQAHALNVQLFHPLIGQRNQGLTVYGSQGLQKHQLEAGMFANFDDNPLEFSLPPDDRVNGIVNRFLTLDVLLSYGVTDWFTFHFNFPFNPYSNVEAIASFQPTADASVGDPKFSATLSLLRFFDTVDTNVHRGGVALIPFFTVPMDNRDDYFGNASWTGGALIALDRHFGKRHYVSVNAGARFREREHVLDLNVNHEALGAISYAVRVWCKHKLDFIFEGQGSTTFHDFLSKEISMPAEAFFGIRQQSANERWEWKVGAGRGANNGYGAPDYRVFAGLSYLFTNGSTPQRHCCDIQPKQVEKIIEPVVEEKVVIALGSVDIEIVDSNDKPVVMPVRVMTNGREAIRNQSNRIRQPIEAGRYVIEVGGAKAVAVQSFIVVAGEETHKKIVIPAPKIQTPETIVRYIEPIFFDSNKDTVKAESFKALDDVYAIIREFPNIDKIDVEAHTDSTGADEYNLDLSNRRAMTAKEYLVRKGVPADIIHTTGFGEVRPIDSNETTPGRAMNRRVEFLIQSPNQNVKILQKK